MFSLVVKKLFQTKESLFKIKARDKGFSPRTGAAGKFGGINLVPRPAGYCWFCLA